MWTKTLKSGSVHGWIACQESEFSRTGATGRRIPRVGICSPYGGTSTGLRFIEPPRRGDCETPWCSQHYFPVIVLCRYRCGRAPPSSRISCSAGLRNLRRRLWLLALTYTVSRLLSLALLGSVSFLVYPLIAWSSFHDVQESPRLP